MHNEIAVNVVAYEPVRSGSPAHTAPAPGSRSGDNVIVLEQDCRDPR